VAMLDNTFKLTVKTFEVIVKGSRYELHVNENGLKRIYEVHKGDFDHVSSEQRQLVQTA
jgi:hypothetical protein